MFVRKILEQNVDEIHIWKSTDYRLPRSRLSFLNILQYEWEKLGKKMENKTSILSSIKMHWNLNLCTLSLSSEFQLEFALISVEIELWKTVSKQNV